MDFFDKINVGVLIGIICALVGGVMLISLRGFFITHPLRCIRRLSLGISDRESRRSLALALAGTLGVGNVYGVAVGIIIGGAGSLFWLFVSAIFALVIKYSECVMAAAKKRLSDNTKASKKDFSAPGMMGVLPATFKRAGKPLAKIYAVLMLALSLLMGSFIQADSLISSAVYLLPMSRIATAVILLFLVVLVVAGGGEKIKNATELMIPLVTGVYIILTLIIILKSISGIGEVLTRIFSSAFDSEAMLFGTIPVINMTAFSEGFARGILSNEAGVGSSTVAHTATEKEKIHTLESGEKPSQVRVKSPLQKASSPQDKPVPKEAQRPSPTTTGLFGMCEIFFDTIILCMLTGIMILLTIENPQSYTSPMTLVFDAVRLGAGDFALPVLLLCIFFFAYSTIICWYYYGGECVAYLGLSRYKSLYLFAFLLFIIFASFVDTYLALRTNDLVLLLMSLPTAAAILKNRKIIRASTVDAGLV